MSIKKDALYEQEYNCKTSDLTESGFPPVDDDIPEGSKMYVWDDDAKALDSVFKKVFNKWMSI